MLGAAPDTRAGERLRVAFGAPIARAFQAVCLSLGLPDAVARARGEEALEACDALAWAAPAELAARVLEGPDQSWGSSWSRRQAEDGSTISRAHSYATENQPLGPRSASINDAVTWRDGAPVDVTHEERGDCLDTLLSHWTPESGERTYVSGNDEHTWIEADPSTVEAWRLPVEVPAAVTGPGAPYAIQAPGAGAESTQGGMNLTSAASLLRGSLPSTTGVADGLRTAGREPLSPSLGRPIDGLGALLGTLQAAQDCMAGDGIRCALDGGGAASSAVSALGVGSEALQRRAGEPGAALSVATGGYDAFQAWRRSGGNDPAGVAAGVVEGAGSIAAFVCGGGPPGPGEDRWASPWARSSAC